MLGSGIIDIAIGLAFIFGVTAALSSVFTELIARFLGLRGAYLLSGLRELLDGDRRPNARHRQPNGLKDAIKNYAAMKDLMQPQPVPRPPGEACRHTCCGTLLPRRLPPPQPAAATPAGRLT